MAIHVARLAGVPAPKAAAGERNSRVSWRNNIILIPACPKGLIRKKGSRSGQSALTGSLFAALPDPLLVELRQIDTTSLTPDGAIELVWYGPANSRADSKFGSAEKAGGSTCRSRPRAPCGGPGHSAHAAGLSESYRLSTLTFREVIDVRGRFAHIPRVYDA